MRIGQEISHERLYLEVWTDGTVSPPEVITDSAEILLEQLSPFVSYNLVAQMEEETNHSDIPTELYNMPVEQLNLSVRTLNCLRRGGITTVGEATSRSEKELMSLRNFGKKSQNELKENLKARGVPVDFSS